MKRWSFLKYLKLHQPIIKKSVGSSPIPEMIDQEDKARATKDDIGVFIPKKELIDWHEQFCIYVGLLRI